MKLSLQQIADAIGARLIGDGRIEVSAVASIDSAKSRDLVFVEDEKYLAAALQSSAGAVIAGDFAASSSHSRSLLISDHPKLAFARAARLLGKTRQTTAAASASSHSTAVIHSSVKLGPGVIVEARVVIAAGAEINDNTLIGPGCSIAAGVIKIGRAHV